MSGIIVIIIALIALMYLAYRGVSLLILAPALAALTVLASSDAPILASYTQIFMGATGGFIIQYFPVFLLGAIFGKLMEDTDSADVMANSIIRLLGEKRAIMAVVLSCAVMTYGGVSLFVVAFAVYPIAAALFQRANIPKRLMPATIALGAFTFTMTALPGTPAIQNAIPMPYFGTSTFAAPGLGIITGLVMLVLGLLWLSFRLRRTAHEGYGSEIGSGGDIEKEFREYSAGEGFDVAELGHKKPVNPPHIFIATLPLILVIAINLIVTKFIIPRMDTQYLSLSLYGETSIEAVRGIWAIISALVASIVVLLLVNLKRLRALPQTLDNGANASLLPIFNTASLVGFGAVIASLAAFDIIRDSVVQLGGDNPIISLAIAVNLLAGMTGSASGGMSIALSTLGTTYMEMAQAAGISPELLHRVTAVSTGGLDALPHNGAVITLLAICGMKHKQAYGDIAMVALVIPIISLVVLIALGTAFGSF